VETAKRHAFLEMVVGTVFAHTKFFEQGHLSLGRLNGATNDALATVEHLKSWHWGGRGALLVDRSGAAVVSAPALSTAIYQHIAFAALHVVQHQ
jgi:hypothetical protein